ncbi:hypothetical protein N3K63_12105 [Microbacterium sp. W1N]|uniref:hypothetical protein n=1 Tax=Microbacterium festucae TaxID=2977531 RepID=UPI0021BF121F|nr:hypothetical protein [Microbacterium festucae]MCT9821022.1 hypothetical protein [Microbacterium festucae]
MANKIGLVLSGSVLIAFFLTWMLVKGTPDVRAWVDSHQLLGFAALGVAWLCLLGGAALIARAFYRPSSGASRETD